MAKNETKRTTEDIESEFYRLFWAARKEHVRLGSDATGDTPDHNAAAAFADAQGWKWAVALLNASHADMAGEDQQALGILAEILPTIPEKWRGLWHFVRGSALCGIGEYDQSIQANRDALDIPTFRPPSNAWNNLGNALRENGDLDGAIEAYRKAIDDPRCDEPGDTWQNLGAALHDKGDLDEAIEAYRKAIDDPRHDMPGYAWKNLGNALRENGDLDGAIEAYRKAIDDPGNDGPGYAWNNLGVALSQNGDHDGAIESYRKAIDDLKDHEVAKAWANLAQAYMDSGDPAAAEEALQRTLDCPDPKGGDHARARIGLRLLKSKIDSDALSPDDRAITDKSGGSGTSDEIEGGIITAIQDAGDTQYDKYMKRSDSGRDNTLSTLRGWSSAVTLLEGSERRWRGGGYFLKWRGYGIVIDPGFDFLRNFHDAGYHGREISAVFVSHNHPDHNSDLKAIDDLRYELFKRRGENPASKCGPYLLLWDQDTDGATEFGFKKPQHHHEPVLMGSGFSQPIDLRDHAAKLPMRVIPFKVNHTEDVAHAMGMVIELLDEAGDTALRIGYTADTGYFQDLHTHLADCHILIAHISQPSIEELQDASKLKEDHLGYRGTARLLKECKPKLALIGEFWAGFTDLRIPLVKGIRRRSGVKTVLPAGLALHVRLPSLEIECTECGKPTALTEARVAPPADNFGSLAYLCARCMIG